MLNGGMFSSEFDDWNTPDVVLERVRKVGPIGLDPCSNAQSIVHAAVEWRITHGLDGLRHGWRGFGLVFCNPPYGDALLAWSRKIAREAEAGVEIITLVPHRTDTEWYRTVARACSAKCEWHGRLTHPRGAADQVQASLFGGAPVAAPEKSGTAPFPSVVLYHGRRKAAFVEAFKDAGEVWTR
jgi:hypothetical protein